jgi:hypothetical protein
VNERTWTAVPYRPELASGVLAFHRTIWPQSEISDDTYHRWQYQDNPAGIAMAALAMEGERVLGQFGALPIRLRIDGRDGLAAVALNVATEPAHRRQGMFAALGKRSDLLMDQANVSAAFAMPNESSFPGFVTHLGYTHAGDIPFLVRPVNVGRLVRARVPLPGLQALVGLASSPFVRRLPPRPRDFPGLRVEEVAAFDGRFDRLWKRLRDRHPVMVVRDALYLNWRFLAIPLREYVCLLATEADVPRGYAVLRVAELLGLRAGLLVDFIVAPGEARAAEALLSHALSWFADEDVDLLATLMLPHTFEYRMLRRYRFWPLPKRLLPQPFRLVARDGPLVRDVRNWFFTLGDYDVV